MKTIVENAQISFRQQLSSYKAITGKSNREIAEMLGCSEATVSHMYSKPLTVDGRYILILQEYLRKAERDRYQ